MMTTLKKLPKGDSETKLQRAVRLWINRLASNYESGVEGPLKDLMHGGCQSGMVSELIYYRDTVAFYKRHRAEIGRMLAETVEDTGLQPAELFGSKWDAEDPLANEHFNQNLLAWFAFEETARNLAQAAGIEL